MGSHICVNRSPLMNIILRDSKDSCWHVKMPLKAIKFLNCGLSYVIRIVNIYEGAGELVIIIWGQAYSKDAAAHIQWWLVAS